MKEVVDAVNARINTPYFGYSILAFFALNWRGIFLLLTTTGNSHQRLAAFDSETNTGTLFFYPLLIGVVIAVSTPWIRYIFGYLAEKPLELHEKRQLEAAHRKTILEEKLEYERTMHFTRKEKNLIEQAQHDVEVAKIEDDVIKAQLTAKIEELRKERDELSEKSSNTQRNNKLQISEAATELLKNAGTNENGAIYKTRTLGGTTIQAGTNFFGNNSPRELSIYEEALDELVEKKVVKDIGKNGQLFKLTQLGWTMKDELHL